LKNGIVFHFTTAQSKAGPQSWKFINGTRKRILVECYDVGELPWLKRTQKIVLPDQAGCAVYSFIAVYLSIACSGPSTPARLTSDHAPRG